MNQYTIYEILVMFIKYRRFITGDSIDNIGEENFEHAFMDFILYMLNNEVESKEDKV